MNEGLHWYDKATLDHCRQLYLDLVSPAVARFCREQEAKGMRTHMGLAMATPSLRTEIVLEDGTGDRSRVKMVRRFPGLITVTAEREGVIGNEPHVSLLEKDWSVDALYNAFRTVAAGLGDPG